MAPGDHVVLNVSGSGIMIESVALVGSVDGLLGKIGMSSTKVYVNRSDLSNGLKRHFDDFTSAYKSSGVSGWVARSDLIRMYAPDNFQAIRGRMSSIEACGKSTLSDDHGFMMKKDGKGKEVFVKIQ